MDILEALYTLRDMAENLEVRAMDDGICANLDHVMMGGRASIIEWVEIICMVGQMAMAWDSFSGDKRVPIGGEYEYDASNLWQGKHLEARLSLIDHMIDMIESGEYIPDDGEDEFFSVDDYPDMGRGVATHRNGKEMICWRVEYSDGGYFFDNMVDEVWQSDEVVDFEPL